MELKRVADLETGQTYDANGRPQRPRILHVMLQKWIIFSEERNGVEFFGKAIWSMPDREPLEEALQRSLYEVVEEMELGDGWLSRGQVTELKLHYLSDNEREVSIERISARLRQDGRQSQVVQTKRIGHDRISDELRRKIFRVVTEAREYLEGFSAPHTQLSIFDDSGKEEKEEEELEEVYN